RHPRCEILSERGRSEQSGPALVLANEVGCGCREVFRVVEREILSLQDEDLIGSEPSELARDPRCSRRSKHQSVHFFVQCSAHRFRGSHYLVRGAPYLTVSDLDERQYPRHLLRFRWL